MSPDHINRLLKSTYGTNLYQEATFRVTWSTDQTEIRKGSFNTFAGKVFLNSKNETKEVKKYPFNQDRWILERWFPPIMLQGSAKELPFSNKGSYEPLYIFEDENQIPLELSWEFITFAVETSLNPISQAERMALDNKMYGLDQQSARFQKEAFDELAQSGSSFEGKLSSAAGEGIVVPSLPEDFENKPNEEKSCLIVAQ